MWGECVEAAAVEGSAASPVVGLGRPSPFVALGGAVGAAAQWPSERGEGGCSCAAALHCTALHLTRSGSAVRERTALASASAAAGGEASARWIVWEAGKAEAGFDSVESPSEGRERPGKGGPWLTEAQLKTRPREAQLPSAQLRTRPTEVPLSHSLPSFDEGGEKGRPLWW